MLGLVAGSGGPDAGAIIPAKQRSYCHEDRGCSGREIHPGGCTGEAVLREATKADEIVAEKVGRIHQD